MKSSSAFLAIALLGAQPCLAQATDAEAEKRRQATEAAKRQAEAARQRAEENAEKSKPKLQHPILRYPGPLERAREAERKGNGPRAVELYYDAARNGSAKAARRLAEIYEQGILGVTRDTAVSLTWYKIARALGDETAERAARERALEGLEREGRETLLLEQAERLERAGKGSDAVRLYKNAVRNGSGKAALRLAQIYEHGIAGVSRDHAESLRWYNTAHAMGEPVPPRKSQ